MRLSTVQLHQAASLTANIAMPFTCFKLLTHYGVGEANALAITAVAPAGKVAYDWARSRRVDIFGCIVLWEILLAVTLAMTFHNARVVLLKGPIQVAALGVACLVSLAIKLPLANVLAQLFNRPVLHIAGTDAGFLGDASPDRLRRVTLVWGLVSLFDAAVRTALIFLLPTDRYLLISRVLQTSYFVGLGLWTVRYGRPAAPAAN